MKLIFAVSCLILTVNSLTVKDQWIQFKKLHNKTYKSLEEEQARYKIFQDNLKIIESHNKKYEAKETTYYMSVNKYNDLTFEEFRKQKLSTFKEPQLENVKHLDSKLKDAPGTFDWRNEGAVNPVRDQGECAASWAFSAISSLESSLFIAKKQLLTLSVQQLVDCAVDYGCDGGWPTKGFDYVKNNDINSEADYPWIEQKQDCHADGNKNVNANVTGFVKSMEDEEELRFAVYNYGPMTASIDATENFKLYGGGIFDDSSCQTVSLNQGVTIVGYGRENEQDFWIVRNSWGESWGENGYIKMIRKKDGQCGIDKYCYAPVIAK